MHSESSMYDPGWQTPSNPVLGAAWSTQAALAWQVAPRQPLVSTHTLASLYEYPTLQAQARSEVVVGRVSWNSLVPHTVIFLQEDAVASKNCMSVHDPHWRFEVGVGAAVSIWVAEHVVNGVHVRSEV